MNLMYAMNWMLPPDRITFWWKYQHNYKWKNKNAKIYPEDVNTLFI